ncbi:MAG TPA: hypothetical protein VME22_19885 [Solirubrobacteraceae bacterium]|nr:hypothetical protein [Solirubrobacteraceae bacterium]
MTWPRRGLIAALSLCAVVCTACGSSHPSGPPWLGLDYNSLPGIGQLTQFVAHRIVYDREGNIEPQAGALATVGSKLWRGVRTSLGAGMVPDLEIDQDPAPGCMATRGCLPVGTAAIASYVRGFVATAQSVLRAFPDHQLLFEPMDEPWDLNPSGPDRQAAATYAAVLSVLLPAIERARDPSIPLDRVYVPATGRLSDSTNWLADLYDAQPCLRPGPATCGPVAGWNVHIYGLPGAIEGGIGALPGLRAQMASGEDNVVVSELGFCALDVQAGTACDHNTPTVDGSSRQVSAWLSETLDEAATMHRAGWLKAVLVWARASGGWSMQLPDGALTAQGRALVEFSDSAAARESPVRSGGPTHLAG